MKGAKFQCQSRERSAAEISQRVGRFEHIKTVLMGTITPHTCIPGLVWQKRARRFSQFEFKVGELRFPIHFVCVSAALYHRGVRGRHFPLRGGLQLSDISENPNNDRIGGDPPTHPLNPNKCLMLDVFMVLHLPGIHRLLPTTSTVQGVNSSSSQLRTVTTGLTAHALL